MLSLRRALPPVIACLLGLLATAGAAADPTRADADPCRQREPGDPCAADDFEGTCRRRRCTRETAEGTRRDHCLVCESGHGHGHHRRRDAAVDAVVRDAIADCAAESVADGAADSLADAPADALPRAVTVAPRAARTPSSAARPGLFACATSPRRDDDRAAGAALLLGALAAARGRRRHAGPAG
jgi:hypothetical protein